MLVISKSAEVHQRMDSPASASSPLFLSEHAPPCPCLPFLLLCVFFSPRALPPSSSALQAIYLLVFPPSLLPFLLFAMLEVELMASAHKLSRLHLTSCLLVIDTVNKGPDPLDTASILDKDQAREPVSSLSSAQLKRHHPGSYLWFPAHSSMWHSC